MPQPGAADPNSDDAERQPLIAALDGTIAVLETAAVPEPEAGGTAMPPEADVTAARRPEASPKPLQGTAEPSSDDAAQQPLIAALDGIIAVLETAAASEPEACRTATPPEADAAVTVSGPQASPMPHAGAADPRPDFGGDTPVFTASHGDGTLAVPPTEAAPEPATGRTATPPDADAATTARAQTEADPSPGNAAQAPLIAALDGIIAVPEPAAVPEPEASGTAIQPEADATAAVGPQASTPGTADADVAEPAPQARPSPGSAPVPDRRSFRDGGRTAPRVPSEFAVFAEGDHVVYPTHGVGMVVKVGTEEIAGHKLDLIHITFDENQMTLRVPVSKAESAGLRKLATRKLFDEVLAVLKSRARVSRTMWSRRAQEYQAKINSGDPLATAEVVRDLYRKPGKDEQSFSERQIFEAALDRLGGELAALDGTDKAAAVAKITNWLQGSSAPSPPAV
jgi:CarD family transcriptional regulator